MLYSDGQINQSVKSDARQILTVITVTLDCDDAEPDNLTPNYSISTVKLKFNFKLESEYHKLVLFSFGGNICVKG